MKKQLLTLALSLCCLSLLAQGQGFQMPKGPAEGTFSKSWTDVNYAADQLESHNLDIYLPNQAQAAYKPIVIIYGSAWFMNNAKAMATAAIGGPLLEAGFAVVSINHRSSADAPWPAQIQDVKAAIRFIRANAATYNLDPSFVGITGFSSGGHLAAYAGVTNGVKSLVSGPVAIDVEGKVGNCPDASSDVNAVVDWFGPVDMAYFLNCTTPNDEKSPEAALIGKKDPRTEPDWVKLISPVNYVNPDDADMLIIHGDADNVVPQCQSVHLKTAYDYAGGNATFVSVPGGGHGQGCFAPQYFTMMTDFFTEQASKPVVKPNGLKDAYQDYFMIGAAVNLNNVTVPEQKALVKREFNSITAENVMKPQPTEPYEGRFDWEDADKVANYARENGIKLRGHCLVWHSQTAEWMFYDRQHNLVSKDVLFARMKKHIEAIVTRYKDVVYAWDVVNEAITDSVDASSPYRRSLYYQIAGDEFIKKAFQYAREADPNAILFYNDYNETDPVKRDRIYNMVKSMKAEGIPIEGIGMQGHYNINSPLEADFDAAITKYATIVDNIHITELDVRANVDFGGGFNFSREAVEISDAVKQKLASQYDMLFRVMRKHKDDIQCVTFWNVGDKDSWLGANNYPLLLDVDYQPKNAYFLVRDFKK